MCLDHETIIKVGIFLASLLLCPLLLWIGKHPIKKYTDSHDGIWSVIVENMFRTPLIFAFVLVVSWFTLKELPFVKPYEKGVAQGYGVLFALNVIWFVIDFIDSILDETHRRSQRINNGENAIDINVIKTIKKVSHFFLWFIGIIWALNILGVDIAALVTTLGIGGVAVAFAAQETVKNIIGGLTILSDRTVRIGDRVVVGTTDGIVEDIGIRTTKIRPADGRLVSIPNGKMVDSSIVNITSEPTRRVLEVIGLTYDTKPEKMREAMEILKTIPSINENLTEKIITVFDDFGDFALKIKFMYYVKSRNELEIMNISSDVNMYILEKFNAAGLNFAFPTQTVILDKPE